jgi:hypothetical protein
LLATARPGPTRSRERPLVNAPYWGDGIPPWEFVNEPQLKANLANLTSPSMGVKGPTQHSPPLYPSECHSGEGFQQPPIGPFCKLNLTPSAAKWMQPHRRLCPPREGWLCADPKAKPEDHLQRREYQRVFGNAGLVLRPRDKGTVLEPPEVV